MNVIFSMIFLIMILLNFFAILAVGLDAEEIIDLEDIFIRMKMIFPKYRAHARLEEAYTKLLTARHKIKSKSKISPEDKKNLTEIEESIFIINRLLSCKGNYKNYHIADSEGEKNK